MQLSSNSDVGSINEKLPVKLNGVDIAIAFNARYFTELLRYITADKLLIKFISSSTPYIVTPAGEQEDLIYLILPVRML